MRTPLLSLCLDMGGLLTRHIRPGVRPCVLLLTACVSVRARTSSMELFVGTPDGAYIDLNVKRADPAKKRVAWVARLTESRLECRLEQEQDGCMMSLLD